LWKVEFRRLQGHQLAGVIERIEPTADSLTEELNAKVRLQPGALADAGFSALLGELAEVRVALPASRDALAIPAQSLRRRGAELGVWQVGRNGLVFVPLQHPLASYDTHCLWRTGRERVSGGALGAFLAAVQSLPNTGHHAPSI
jgi:multidrug efflux pump subunit AcrA (membrane-fusion protein)